MDTTSFMIELNRNGRSLSAEIRPCCREDNVVDYAVWVDNKLEFTITRDHEKKDHWVIALKNADDEFDDAMVQTIGAGINERER